MKWLWFLLGAAVITMGEAARRFFATGYSRGQPVPVELLSIGGSFYLESRGAAPAFLEMQRAAAQDGVRLVVESAFRSMAEQQDLERRYAAGETGIGKPARAGHSNHQLGLAVDLETANGTNAAFAWLKTNAARYGFKRTVSGEPWHWEYREEWAEEALLS